MKYSHMKLIFDLACAALLVVPLWVMIFDLNVNVMRLITYLGILAYIILVVMVVNVTPP